MPTHGSKGRMQALALSQDGALRKKIAAELAQQGYQVREANSFQAASTMLGEMAAAVVVMDSVRGDQAAFSFLEKIGAGTSAQQTRWVVLAGEICGETAERFSAMGIFSLLPRDCSSASLREALEGVEAGRSDPLLELMQMVERISGVQLKRGKRALAETRLGRRVRALKLRSLDAYLEYFQANKAQELPEVISLFTTHTTEFFRESEQYDFLYDNLLPTLFAAGRRPIRIWSAASSTGQEVYSLAITLLEYAREHRIAPEQMPEISILGTDIDLASVGTAAEGVYPANQLVGIPEALVDRYFDRGEGELAHLLRVKDHVHRLCRFERGNLLAGAYPVENMDVIFLRNVLIYFKPDDVAAIAKKMQACLRAGGHLFLGLSESFQGLPHNYRTVGNSIYANERGSKQRELAVVEKVVEGEATNQLQAIRKSARAIAEAKKEKHPQPNSTVSLADMPDLIAIGASTGGVEALKTVLEQFPAQCPPILIVQHIPAAFSAPLAKRLNATCQVKVCEAQDRQKVEPGCVYIAPGGKQMSVVLMGDQLLLQISDDPPVNLHKPSVDYLFRSLLPVARRLTIQAALLTGMGADGARGLRDLRAAGVHTVAQNEATSTVFGMPKMAIELGGASEILGLPEIAAALIQKPKARREKRSA